MDTYLDMPMINSKQPLLVLSTRNNTKEPSFRDYLSNPEIREQMQRILHQLDRYMRMSQAIVDSHIRMQLEPLTRFSNWFDDFCEGGNEQAKNDFGFAYEIFCLMIKEIDIEGEEYKTNELGREPYSAILKGLYKYLGQYPVVYIDLKPLPSLHCEGTDLENLIAEEYEILFSKFISLSPWESMRQLKQAPERIKYRIRNPKSSSNNKNIKETPWEALRRQRYEKSIFSLESARSVSDLPEIVIQLNIDQWLSSIEDPQYRKIARLKYVQGFTDREIADELSIPKSTINNWLKKISKPDF
jgi:CI repressor-like protein